MQIGCFKCRHAIIVQGEEKSSFIYYCAKKCTWYKNHRLKWGGKIFKVVENNITEIYTLPDPEDCPEGLWNTKKACSLTKKHQVYRI